MFFLCKKYMALICKRLCKEITLNITETETILLHSKKEIVMLSVFFFSILDVKTLGPWDKLTAFL